MGNDQLLPAYNVQFGVCDEYIAVYDVKQFASDMDCFVPLMEKFNNIYGKYPKYPVADAGYGSFEICPISVIILKMQLQLLTAQAL